MLNDLRNNNAVLLIILLGLIGIAYFLITLDPEDVQLGVGENKFTVNDPGNIDSIRLSNNEGTYTFINEGERWSLDNQYKLDQRLKQLLLAVLNQVNVTRPVANNARDSVLQQINNRGAAIKLYRNGESIKSIKIAGNESLERTYFMEAGTEEPFVVGIPGYNSYIASLFFLNRNQWRDKVIFNSTFRSLKTLELEYSETYQANHNLQDMEITYQDDFFEIEGVNHLDSAALFNYLKNYRGFEANNYLEANTSINLDSLDNVTPFLTVKLTDIDASLNNQLALYDHEVIIRGTPMIPGKILSENNEWVLIRKDQVDALTQPVDQFIRDEDAAPSEVPLDNLPQ